ncbi:MAG: HAMP domain-containing sensor histidine kinase [Pseudomonadota bacterium]
MSLDLLILNTLPTWEVRLRAISNVLFGLSCLAGLVVLTYLGRKFRDLPARAAYLPFGALLGVTAVSHFAHSLALLPDLIWVASSLRALKALCAVGSVALLGSVVVRIDSLLARERGALQRESDLTAVLKELSSAYARLQNLDELKTQVFANVSHELRTPLTLILGPIQDLREAAGLNPEQHASLAVVERNARLLLGHVNDLLELSRADAVGVELERKPTDVRSLLRTLAASFRPLAANLSIEYQVELQLSPRPHLVDPQKLERIAMNLLANAFKFTPSGGSVALCVQIAEESETGEGRAELVLAVDDSGPGIRSEDRERVFERFRQLDGKPNRAFSGTGLGLSNRARIRHCVRRLGAGRGLRARRRALRGASSRRTRRGSAGRRARQLPRVGQQRRNASASSASHAQLGVRSTRRSAVGAGRGRQPGHESFRLLQPVERISSGIGVRRHASPATPGAPHTRLDRH